MENNNPYAAPGAEISSSDLNEVEYVGFWPRVGATMIDSIIVLAITYPILFAIYGTEYLELKNEKSVAGVADMLLSWGFPAVAAIMFWVYKQGTPGKFAISARVVDAKTGGPLSVGQAIGRYAGYFVSSLPLGLGLLWVAWDSKKQGWHDKLAGTLVVRARNR